MVVSGYFSLGESNLMNWKTFNVQIHTSIFSDINTDLYVHQHFGGAVNFKLILMISFQKTYNVQDTNFEFEMEAIIHII